MNTKQIIKHLDTLIQEDNELTFDTKTALLKAKEKIEKAKTKQELIEALVLIGTLLEVGIKIFEVLKT